MATPQTPTIPGFEPDERSNCRVAEFGSPDPNVLALPALVLDDAVKTVLSRWKMTGQERLLAYLTGDVYLYTQTMGQPLQPLSVSFERPAIENEDGEGTDTPASSQVPQFGVLFDVLQERRHQDKEWGLQRHSPELWLTILTEEVGEAAQSILHDRFGGKAKGTLRRELVQVAAVAMAWLEAIDDPKGTGAQAQSAFSGEIDDVLRRMVQDKGGASVIKSLGKAVSGESFDLALSLDNLGYLHQLRMNDAQKTSQQEDKGADQ